MADARITRQRTRTVQARVTITADVTEGNVSPTDLERWIAAALAHYHVFRGGFVGIDAGAGICLPKVKID